MTAIAADESSKPDPRSPAPCTANPRLFVSPQELCKLLRANGLELERLIGASVRPLATLRARAIVLARSRSLAVAYCGFFVKTGT